MDGRHLVLETLNGRQGPIPWVEIAVDEPIVAKLLGKLPVDWVPEAESEIYLGLSWDDKAAFAERVGLHALGIYHWESLGSYQVRDRRVISRQARIRGRVDLDKMCVPNLTAADLTPEVERARQAMRNSRLALFVEFPFCFDPAVGDLGFANFCYQIHDDPGFVAEVFGRYEAHIGNLIDIYSGMAEVDFIWIGDDLAFRSGPFLSPAMLRELVFPVFRRLADRIRKPWIFHSDGDLSLLWDDILALGCSAVHPIEPTCNDIYALKNAIGGRVCLHGGLSVDLLARGTPAEVAVESERLLSQVGRGGGYLFSSGNSIPYYARVENVLAMAETVRRYNAQFQPVRD